MKSLGFFLQLTGIILLPSVLIWALMGKVSASVELTMLLLGAALFYVGSVCDKRGS